VKWDIDGVVVLFRRRHCPRVKAGGEGIWLDGMAYV
jgi:hypothetical protein